MVCSAIAQFERLCESRPAPHGCRPMFFSTQRRYGFFGTGGEAGGVKLNFSPIASL